MMNQQWFEMPEVRRRRLDAAVWVPLLASDDSDTAGEPGYEHYKEEYIGYRHVAVPLERREEAERVEWTELNAISDPSGWVDDGTYVPAQVFRHYGEPLGEFLAFSQHFNSSEHAEWHLSQDVVLTLGLKREGDIWLRVEEGYAGAARLLRKADGSPKLLEIKASYLKDYLRARGMALYVSSYRSRVEVLADGGHISWPPEPYVQTNGMEQWEGRIQEIHEGGMRFGESRHVFHMSRTDVDPDEDVPSMGVPTDDNTTGSSWTRESSGKKLYRISGELWKNEWVEPAELSPIVRGDEVEPTAFFITDARGTQEGRDTLVGGDGRWLWFRPGIINAILSVRGAFLGWYTRYTGNVGCSPGRGVHFGVNRLGLVNVYAKDIGLLPNWQQRIRSGYSVGPDGKVSGELLASQVNAVPAATQAPEAYLGRGIDALNAAPQKAFGAPFIKKHSDAEEILLRIHRFRATDRASLLALVKDLARITADSFDTGSMAKVVKPPKDVKWGSLKWLQNVLATLVGADRAREVMGPLFAVYDLRLADAHLPGDDVEANLARVEIDSKAPLVMQAETLLRACVGCIYEIHNIIQLSLVGGAPHDGSSQ